MKKLSKIFGASIMLGVGLFGLVSCGSSEDKSESKSENNSQGNESSSASSHTHSYSTDWTSDDSKHWHAATCGDDLKNDENYHTLNTNGQCSVCNYYIKGSTDLIYGVYDYDKKYVGANAYHSSGDVVIPYYYEDYLVTELEECTYNLNITSFTIFANLSTIKSDCFFNCTSLEFVVLPASLKTIEEDAFLFCSSLTNVYYSGSIAQWSMIDIESGNDSLTSDKIYYYSEEEAVDTEHKFWHFVNGIPTLWV